MLLILAGCLVLAIVLYFLGKWAYDKLKTTWKLAKWKNLPKDKLIVHVVPPCRNVASASPFVLKVLLYLRINQIPYEVDWTEPFGPLGKTPWISWNGHHVPDSQFIIEFINKKFDKNLSAHVSDRDRAIGRTVRMMLENHTFWGIGHWRWVENYFNGIHHVYDFVPYTKLLIWLTLSRRMKIGSSYHGLTLHPISDVHRIVQDDLRTVSTLLGNKKFIFGDQISEEDCSIFGFLAQCLWGLPGSPYEEVIMSDELSNLKEYCERIKSIYFKDWDSHLLI